MSARQPKGPLDYARNTPLRLWVGLVLLLLYAPLTALVAFSFNESRRNIVWTGFTFDWSRGLRTATYHAFVNS